MREERERAGGGERERVGGGGEGERKIMIIIPETSPLFYAAIIPDTLYMHSGPLGRHLQT